MFLLRLSDVASVPENCDFKLNAVLSVNLSFAKFLGYFLKFFFCLVDLNVEFVLCFMVIHNYLSYLDNILIHKK